MNHANTFFVKDFILVVSKEKSLPSPDAFSCLSVDVETTLYYQSTTISSVWEIEILNGGIKIANHNSFIPFFCFNAGAQSVITSNYAHILELAPSLIVNYDGIREFVLYHTPLNENTFHKDVSRIFGVRRICIENCKIKYEKSRKESTESPVLDVIRTRIKYEMEQLQRYSHGILLSGGSESRINAAASLAYQVKKDFITWGHPENIENLIAKNIAERELTEHINLRPDSLGLPYDEILKKSGYLSNMQYAYRYSAIKSIFQTSRYDAIWTGWGDLNGYPLTKTPSELFSEYYLGLYKGERKVPIGWNRNWLGEYSHFDNIIEERIKSSATLESFFFLEKELFAPAIFGQVLSMENTIGSVVSPWFHPTVYHAISNEEYRNKNLITNKKKRLLWKNELYYRLLKEYCPSFNYIKNAKGYYHFQVQKQFGYPGLLLAGIMKHFASSKTYPFDPIENKSFIIIELKRIEAEGKDVFSRKEIQDIISTNINWTGPQILEYFKLIQVNMFLNL